MSQVTAIFLDKKEGDVTNYDKVYNFLASSTVTLELQEQVQYFYDYEQSSCMW